MTAAIDTTAERRPRGFWLPLALRLALRDLRGGFAGFTIFLICIALGTGAIGAINSLSDAIQDALAREGTVLLGGDVEATLVHRQANADELAYLKSFGEVSEVATMRAMARIPDGSAQALVDLKAVDDVYPLYGAVTFEEGGGLAAVREGGLAVDRSILDQLQVSVGDNISIGNALLPVKAVLEQEPDRLAAGPAFGARILLSPETLKKTGLVEPGSLVRWAYRIKTGTGAPPDFRRNLAAQFPEAGFLVRDSSDPSPGVKSTLKRLTEFLTLVGLTAMLTGGIGVANAVAAFVESRRMTIATYKSLGATHRTIFRVLFIEIGFLALVGILIGFAIAAGVPWLIASLMAGFLPIAIEPGLQGQALALAAVFGLLTALPFILWPLGRAAQVSAAELFRGAGENGRLPPAFYWVSSLLIVALLALVAVLLAREHRIAAFTCAALFGVFVLFWSAGAGIRRLAAAVKRPKRPEMALALANIGGPASLSRTIALSLGAGLTLLTAVSLVDASLSDELKTRLPERAPSYFFIGIPKRELSAFENSSEREGSGRTDHHSADAARPVDGPSRCGRRPDQSPIVGRVGSDRRPGHHLFGDAAFRLPSHGGRLVARRLRRRAPRLLRSRYCKGSRPQNRGYGHRQRSWPQPHRQNRELPQSEMGLDRYQLRHDLFPERAAPSPIHLSRDIDLA